MIGAAELALMKESAYLVNVTRGGIIDEDALCQALADGQLAGAGLAVAAVAPLGTARTESASRTVPLVVIGNLK